MGNNVILLPRPRSARTGQEPLGFYVRVGWNDHKDILDLIATGERGVFGFVVGASSADRHKEVIAEARNKNFDVVLDPQTQQMAFPGSYNSLLKALPWGKSQQHQTIADYDGDGAKMRARAIVEFAIEHNFTQIVSPSHLLSDPNDPWLRRDIASAALVRDQIQSGGANVDLIYSLALPIAVLRDDSRRGAIVAALADAPYDAIWLKVENFGDDATGEKTAAYIKGCRDFHARGLPIVADYVGGLPGLGALAFGAVGGISHGVTVNQNFRAASWRLPRREHKGGSNRRVYLHQLDMLLEPSDARLFMNSSQRVRGRHVCGDTHCCPRGLSDMVDRPSRHALFQRAREIEAFSSIPSSLRVSTYLDRVRAVSDAAAFAAGLDKIDANLRKKLQEKQKGLGRFRDVMAHLSTEASTKTVAVPPLRRSGSGPA